MMTIGFLARISTTNLRHCELLLGRERQLGLRVGPDRAIDVKPGVHHAHLDQPVEPLFAEQVEVRLAEAGADAGHHLVLQAVLQALHRLAEHARAAAALVADDLVPFDADQRRDVAELAELLGDFVGDEVAVGEDLKVAVAVAAEDFQHLRVHERLAAEDAEERVAHRLGFGDQPVHRRRLDLRLLGRHIDPAALAAEVAAVDDRDVEERRKELAPLEPRLVLLHRAHALEAEIPGQLPEQPLVGFQQQAFGEAEVHRQLSFRCATNCWHCNDSIIAEFEAVAVGIRGSD